MKFGKSRDKGKLPVLKQDISKLEIDLAIEKFYGFTDSDDQVLVISFGDLGKGFPPAIQIEIKKVTTFKNLLITFNCEVTVDDLNNILNSYELSFSSDSVIIGDLFEKMRMISNFEENKLEVLF